LDEIIGFKEIENDYKVYSKDLDLTNLYQSLEQYNLSLEESVNFSYENRYEIKKQMSQIKVAKVNSYLASSEYYPSIYLNADYTKQEVDKFKSSLPKDQWQASLNLDWNIYQGGATDATTQEKKVKIDIANSNLAYSKLLIKTKTTQAYINVHKAKDSVELAQSILQVSSEKFKQASKRYEHGLSDFIELQQSRQGYIDAMASLIVDYYDYYNSIAILDNAIGK
jgi:outer membrane protein TolC